MALSIKDPETDRLAREIAQRSGESLTEAVKTSLRERVERLRHRQEPTNLAERIMTIGRRCAELPELDSRSADEIIGYDKNGLPR
jgi:antitoxin VapB